MHLATRQKCDQEEIEKQKGTCESYPAPCRSGVHLHVINMLQKGLYTTIQDVLVPLESWMHMLSLSGRVGGTNLGKMIISVSGSVNSNGIETGAPSHFHRQNHDAGKLEGFACEVPAASDAQSHVGQQCSLSSFRNQAQPPA